MLEGRRLRLLGALTEACFLPEEWYASIPHTNSYHYMERTWKLTDLFSFIRMILSSLSRLKQRPQQLHHRLEAVPLKQPPNTRPCLRTNNQSVPMG